MRYEIIFSIIFLIAVSIISAETFTFTIPDAYLQNPAGEQPLLLSVNGTGNVKATPDQVVITATIYDQDKKPGKAYDNNAMRMRTLLDKLRAAGIEKNNVATESLVIDTVYKSGSDKADYYYVSRTIKIFQDDMDNITPVLDALVDAGIEDIGYIDFVVKDLDGKYAEALEAAATDCRKTADTLASAMGARIVNMHSVSYDFGGYNPYETSMYRGGFGSDTGMSYTGYENQLIVPREVTTTVNVYATYEIEYTGL